MLAKPPIAGASPTARLQSKLVSRMPTQIGDLNNLSQTLTIGGTAYAPTAYLVADDIVPATGVWASRHNSAKTLSVSGSGTAPTYGVDTAIVNDAVKYAAAKYHKAADTTWGTFGALDGAIEIVCSFPTTLGYLLTTNNAATGSEKGFTVYHNGGALQCYLDNGSGTAVSLADSVARIGMAHYLLAFDRSEKAYLFVNGVYVSSADISALTGDITESPLTVAAAPNGTVPSSASVSYCAVWALTGDPWPGAATNQVVMGAIAAERFATLAGIGCAKNTAYSFTRATTAYVDRYTGATTRQLFPVSSGWPRVCQRQDNTGALVPGYLSEVAATNDFTYSEDASSWSQVRCTISANATTAPDGTLTADGIVSDAGSNTHYVNLECPAAATQHIFSAWLKAGDQSWARMDIHTLSNAYAYFDVSNGAVGTVGADVASSGIEAWGNGWYRCWIEYTGGAPAHDHHIHTADSDGGQTWNPAGGTINLYVWGAQHEDDGTVIPSSYVKTAAAAATRNKDVLTRTVALDTSKFRLEATALLGSSHNSTQTKTLFALDDGTADNACDITVGSTDVATLTLTTGAAAQAAIAGSQDITNGLARRAVAHVRANDVRMLISGAADGTPDTSATVAASYTTLRVGCATTSATQQPTGLLSDVRLYKDVQ